MTLDIVTDAPKRVRKVIKIQPQDIIDFVNDRLQAESGDEDAPGLPEGATLFLTSVKNEDDSVANKAIRNTDVTTMYLTIPFFEDADGHREAQRGRGDNVAETTSEPASE